MYYVINYGHVIQRLTVSDSTSCVIQATPELQWKEHDVGDLGSAEDVLLLSQKSSSGWFSFQSHWCIFQSSIVPRGSKGEPGLISFSEGPGIG